MQAPFAVLCIGGVVSVLQPWKDSFKPTLTVILLGYAGAVMNGITKTLDVFIIYHYKYLQEIGNQVLVTFWCSLFGVVLSVIGSIAIEKQEFYLSWFEWILVFGHCSSYGSAFMLERNVKHDIEGNPSIQHRIPP